MDVGLQQPKTSQFPWVSHPDAVPVEIWETPPAVRRRRGVSHIPTGCRIQLGFYSFKCDKGGIAFRWTRDNWSVLAFRFAALPSPPYSPPATNPDVMGNLRRHPHRPTNTGQ